MKRTIEVTIGNAGEIKIDALNFKGADCDQATKYLEEALGVVGQTMKKPEYHQSQHRKTQQRLGT